MFVFFGLVVLLCYTLRRRRRAEDDVAHVEDVEDEDEVESDGESEKENKVSGYISVLNCSKRSQTWFNSIS